MRGGWVGGVWCGLPHSNFGHSILGPPLSLGRLMSRGSQKLSPRSNYYKAVARTCTEAWHWEGQVQRLSMGQHPSLADLSSLVGATRVAGVVRGKVWWPRSQLCHQTLAATIQLCHQTLVVGVKVCLRFTRVCQNVYQSLLQTLPTSPDLACKVW